MALTLGNPHCSGATLANEMVECQGPACPYPMAASERQPTLHPAAAFAVCRRMSVTRRPGRTDAGQVLEVRGVSSRTIALGIRIVARRGEQCEFMHRSLYAKS